MRARTPDRLGVVDCAVSNAPARRPHQRREQREHRGLAGAVRPEQPEDRARSGAERDARQRPSSAEMT